MRPSAQFSDLSVFLGTKSNDRITINNDLIGMLTAIANRDYLRFQELEKAFVCQQGEEVWQEVFNFRVLPALNKPVSQ